MEQFNSNSIPMRIWNDSQYAGTEDSDSKQARRALTLELLLHAMWAQEEGSAPCNSIDEHMCLET